MARTEASILFIFNRQVQLVDANLVPGASLASRSGFRHLFESQHRAVEFFGRGFQFRSDRDVHMMERSAHYSSLKFGFSIIPNTFPKGSLAVATLIPPPTS